MKNKLLVTIIVPSIELEYDVYIPNNKMIGTIKKYIVNSVIEMSHNTFTKKAEEVSMIDRNQQVEYDSAMYVKDTGIKNGTKLIIM